MENEVKYKEIKLGGKNGGIAFVSDEDYDSLNKYSWHKDKRGYISANINGKRFQMHRFVVNAQNNEIVDHINRIKHDNRKDNLRILSGNDKDHINACNRGICKNKISSKYKGVFFHTKQNKFYVKLVVKGKQYNLGTYDNEIDAAEKFDLYVVHNNLEYIELNFPNKRNEYLKQEYKFSKKEKQFDYYGIEKTKTGYTCHVIINGKKIYIGFSKELIQCAKIYDKYIYDNNIPQKKLNFPEDYSNYNPNSKIKVECKQLNENTIQLLLNNTNEVVLIDVEDYDKLKYFNVYYHKESGYIKIIVNRKTSGIHRFLMNVSDPLIFIDHINNNRLDNRKCNLRLSNASKNAHNITKRINTSSKYIGVFRDILRQIWIVNVKFNNKTVFRYSYKNEEHAARSRDLYILNNLKNEHYKLNFEWTDQTIKEWTDILNNNT